MFLILYSFFVYLVRTSARQSKANSIIVSLRQVSCILYAATADTFSVSLPTPTMLVGVGRAFSVFCLSVCLFVCLQHNSKTNDPKLFKLDMGNDLGIS